MRTIVFLFLTFTISSCVASSSSKWANQYESSMDALVCVKAIEDDYFLVGKRGANFTVGYRLKVGIAGEHPSPYEISWKFKDSSGRYIEIYKPRKVISSKVYQENGYTYVDELEERQVNTKDLKTFEVKVAVQKYNSKNGETELSKENGRKVLEDDLVRSTKKGVRLDFLTKQGSKLSV